jgi:selenide, water dikinase
VLAALPRTENPNLLVGMETHDDAGVFRISPDLALIQTVDFFTPIVDDPFDFGAIAATNAFSDVYAMGGRPLTAMNVVGFPQGELPWNTLREILLGGHEVVHEAGAVLAGGHSVKAPELFFGLSVTGVIHPDRIVTNAGALPGDRLFLTKPIGTGVLTTALKRGKLDPEHLAIVTASMRRLNAAAAEAMVEVGVSAATDITGFGLLGHMYEMLVAAQVDCELDATSVPLLPGALDHARSGDKPGGLNANRRYVEPHLDGTDGIDPAILDLLFDPQTSGGLLIAVPEAKADALAAVLEQRGVQDARKIGRIAGSGTGKVRLKAR